MKKAFALYERVSSWGGWLPRADRWNLVGRYRTERARQQSLEARRRWMERMGRQVEFSNERPDQ